MRFDAPKIELYFSAEEALAIAKFEEISEELENYHVDPLDVIEGICKLVKSNNTVSEYDDFVIEIEG